MEVDGSPVGPPASGLALELIDIVKEYAGEPPVRALDSVSLEVRHGELAAIVGPSGSGKSTLLHIIGTLDRPTSGIVRVSGVETSQMSDRQLSGVRSHLIGFVFQSFFLLEGMTAVDNVANGVLYRGKHLLERREAAAEALRRVGLEHRLMHTPSQMSGGAVMDLLRELHAEGRTILIITHDRELASSLPRRVLMRDGAIEAIEDAVDVPARIWSS
ncbi:MAG: ABC transporter ATP-binding protein [Ilumatobacteraceae bacterium]